MKKTIFVAGATGFIGSCFVNACLEGRDYRVLALKRTTSDTRRIKRNFGQVTYYSLDKYPLRKIFERHRIDCVVNFAVEYGRESRTLLKLIDANIVLPAKLAILSKKHRVKSFVNTDSFFTKPEIKGYRYLKNYTLSKRFLLWILKKLDKNIKIVNMRLEHVYGPNDRNDKFIPKIIRDIESKKPCIPLTDGLQKRDFIYVGDVVNAYNLIINNIQKPYRGFVEYQVGTGESTTVRSLVEMVSELLKNRETVLDFGALENRSGEIWESKAEKRKMVPSWKAVTGLKEGLKKTIEAGHS